MTFDLGPTAPTTGFPACRDSLRKLLTDASNPGAVRLIAINPTLRAETEELLPGLNERSAPDRDGLLEAASTKAMPSAPVAAKPDAPMTPLARELIAAGMKNVAQPVTKDDPGVVL